MIHLPDLLFGNFPGKVKVSLFVSAEPVQTILTSNRPPARMPAVAEGP